MGCFFYLLLVSNHNLLIFRGHQIVRISSLPWQLRLPVSFIEEGEMDRNG